MNKFFCADAARQAGEDMVGSATYYQTYVLVECAVPWRGEAFETEAIPETLRSLIQEYKQMGRSVRFLLITQQPRRGASTKIIIYDRTVTAFQKYERDLESLSQAPEAIADYFAGNLVHFDQSASRDVLICTHGSHDQCCARYGNPFYAEATAMVQELGLTTVRVWKSSHFGGHRFAPTAITFPDGRYFGRLDINALQSILTRTSDVNQLQQVYRGWSILPTELQVVERDLWIRHGWEWLDYQVFYRWLKQGSEQMQQAEFTCRTEAGQEIMYRTEIAIDPTCTTCTKGSCGAMQESIFEKYRVVQLQVLQPALPIPAY